MLRRFAALLAISIVVIQAAPASASGSDLTALSEQAVAVLVAELDAAGSDAESVWNTFSDEEQQAVNEAMTAESEDVEVTEGTTPALLSGTTYCRWAQVEVWAKNAWGWKLWSYFQKINWCYDGTYITSLSRTRWGETYYLFWQFNGHIGNTESGGVGKTSYRAWTQGSYSYCIGWQSVGCIQHKYPWIDMTARGNGTWNYSWGG